MKIRNNKKIITCSLMVLIILTGIIIGINYKSNNFEEIEPINESAIALYANGSAVDQVPSGTWGIDQKNSFCTTNGGTTISDKDSSIDIIMQNNKIILNNMKKKNTKCKIYLVSGTSVSQVIATLNAKAQTSSVPDFSSTATTDEGVYYTTDDNGTTYYYRGAVTNNYVKFGKLGLTSSGSDMWWRIIRFNGDGSIRLIYDGTEYHANGTSTTNSIAIASQKYSHTEASSKLYSLDNAYVGYMYGTAGSSTYDATHANINSSNAKTQLETWYTNNLADEEAYIDKNAGFCGDRSIYRGTGYGSSGITYYGVYNRLFTNNTPTFNCPQQAKDLYTISASNKGNKAINKPIGLITADEVTFAGGKYGANSSNIGYYLYNGQNYWTMTPSKVEGGGTDVLRVDSKGYAYITLVYMAYGLRPVINLKAGTQLTGSGTQSSPYQVVG